VIQQQLASAIRMVVQVSRLQDGSRKIVSIAEVRGAAGDRVDVRDIFVFDRIGLSDQGKVQGRFHATSETPKVLERLKVHGIELPKSVFEEVVNVNL
jgi:pilus assembly protein CpaF